MDQRYKVTVWPQVNDQAIIVGDNGLLVFDQSFSLENAQSIALALNLIDNVSVSNLSAYRTEAQDIINRIETLKPKTTDL